MSYLVAHALLAAATYIYQRSREGFRMSAANVRLLVCSGCVAVGAALAAIGLPPVLLSARAGGPAYRITGRRRIARLAELVGDPPDAAPEGAWPVV